MRKLRIYGLIAILLGALSELMFSGSVYAKEIVIADINGNSTEFGSILDESESNNRSINLAEYLGDNSGIKASKKNWEELNSNPLIYEGFNATSAASELNWFFTAYDIVEKHAGEDPNANKAYLDTSVAVIESEVGASHLRYYQDKMIKVVSKGVEALWTPVKDTAEFLRVFISGFDPKSDFYSIDNIKYVEGIENEELERFKTDICVIIKAQDATKPNSAKNESSNTANNTTDTTDANKKTSASSNSSSNAKDVDVDSFLAKSEKIMSVSKGTRLYSSSGQDVNFGYEIEIVGDGCFVIAEKIGSELVVGTIDKDLDVYMNSATIENESTWEVISLGNGMITLSTKRY